MPVISFEQFAERNGFEMRASYDKRRTDKDGWTYDAWTVGLSINNGPDEKFFITFRMGVGHEKRPPNVEDVLASLTLDARSAEDSIDFEDWAENFGYDGDSRKAEALYAECVEQTERFKDWLGPSLFAELLECEEDSDEPTIEEIHDRFDSEILPLVQAQYEPDGIRDIPARCEAFNDWVDSLQKDGEISEWLAYHIHHPSSCD